MVEVVSASELCLATGLGVIVGVLATLIFWPWHD